MWLWRFVFLQNRRQASSDRQFVDDVGHTTECRQHFLVRAFYMKQYNAYFRLVTDTSPSNILFKLILFRFSGAVQDVNSVCDGFVPCEKLCSDSGCWHKQEVGAGLSQLSSVVHQNQPVCEKTELCQFFWVQEKIWQKNLDMLEENLFLSDPNCCRMRKTKTRHCSEIILASGLQVHLLSNSTSSCRSGFWRRGAHPFNIFYCVSELGQWSLRPSWERESGMSSLQRKNGVGPFFHPAGPGWSTGRRYTSPSPALGHHKEEPMDGHLGLEVSQLPSSRSPCCVLLALS